MKELKYAQLGVITNPTTFVEYLVFKINLSDEEGLKDAISQVLGIQKAISQKDGASQMSISIGIGNQAWNKIFPKIQKPKELHDFIELQSGERKFPSTKGDIFFMVKSERMDLNFQASKYIKRAFDKYADLIEDYQGFKYLDSRDLIDFVDGTENPKNQERLDAVLVNDDIEIHNGGSYLILQKYVDKDNLKLWDSKPIEYQEQVIGRTKFDNIEFSDETKPAWAHTAKSKVEIDGEEIKMFRQNRAFGNAMEHGTIFVGFAASPSIIEKSLNNMIMPDEDGNYDRLLDFVDAKTGNLYFMPSMEFLLKLSD